LKAGEAIGLEKGKAGYSSESIATFTGLTPDRVVEILNHHSS